MDRDPEIYSDICELKEWIVAQVAVQREGKAARKTGTLPEDHKKRLAVLEKSWSAALDVSLNRYWITCALIRYGQLRAGKQHTVNPQRKSYYAFGEDRIQGRIQKQKELAIAS